MKIIYLAPSIIPSRAANSIHVMKMCQAFAKNGHEVTLIVPDRKDETEPGVKDDFEFYGVEPCFKIERIRWYKVKGRDHLYGLLAALKAKKLTPDLVYSRIIAGAYFAAKLGFPTTFESHAPAYYAGKFSERFFRSLSFSKNLIKLVAITNSLKEYHETHYPHIAGKIFVAPDGADPIVNTAVEMPVESKGEGFQVGYVGHLYKGRGIEIIIELAKRCPWADFHLIGGTQEDLEYWKGNSCPTNILFHGFVPPAETVKMLKRFDVLLAPYQKKVSTISDKNSVQWMSPLKIFEYMAVQKPIISSDLPVLHEVLKPGFNALLCLPDNINEWVFSLEKLRNNELLRQELSKNAYQEFTREYTWNARAKRVLQANY